MKQVCVRVRRRRPPLEVGLRLQRSAVGRRRSYMRIGIDGGTWGNPRGYGRFTRELVCALANLDRRNSYTIFVDPHTARSELPANIEIITVPVREAPSRAASADGYRSPRDIWAFSRAIASAPVDLIFFPSVYTFVPLTRRVPSIVTIHDVIPERFPQYIFKNSRAKFFWNAKTRLAVQQATRILTVSEHARRGIEKYLSVPRGKICVTSEAPAQSFRPIVDQAAVRAALTRVGLPPNARAVMYLGGITPHKNLSMLVQVFAELIRDECFRDLKLVIAGDYARDVFYSNFPALQSQVRAHCADSVIFTGYVPDETAALLLNGAEVLVLPSLDEGFGLPGIEAAACGTPVIATESSALPELLGDAALYIDPKNPAALREALLRVLGDSDLRHRMRARGIERARALTWEDSAACVLQVFEEVWGGQSLARGVA